MCTMRTDEDEQEAGKYVHGNRTAVPIPKARHTTFPREF